MLNSSPVPGTLAVPGKFIPARKPGGQPFNRNAYKHGLYAFRSEPEFIPVLKTVSLLSGSLQAASAVMDQVALQIRSQIFELFSAHKKTGDLRAVLAWNRPILHYLNLYRRVRLASYRMRLPSVQLGFVAAHAIDLIRSDFFSCGITRDADSFREKFEKSDFYSSQPEPISPAFLPPLQWAVLEPLIPPTEYHAGPGRPPADPRLLLDAIFWKLSRHATWQDLPAGSPPMLTCRRYYRRLFLSGRLRTFYKALEKDLLSRGRVTLPDLHARGCFEIAGNALVLTPDLPGVEQTWQMRTALLLMQVAFQAFRRLSRPAESLSPHAFPRLPFC